MESRRRMCNEIGMKKKDNQYCRVFLLRIDKGQKLVCLKMSRVRQTTYLFFSQSTFCYSTLKSLSTKQYVIIVVFLFWRVLTHVTQTWNYHQFSNYLECGKQAKWCSNLRIENLFSRSSQGHMPVAFYHWTLQKVKLLFMLT